MISGESELDRAAVTLALHDAQLGTVLMPEDICALVAVLNSWASGIVEIEDVPNVLIAMKQELSRDAIARLCAYLSL